jgi:hypothetical protein
MNIENEKKWFVYVGDHHEGPFNAQEVSEKKNAGLVTEESYVWCEGMNDWVMLSDAKELSSEMKKLEPSTPTASGKSDSAKDKKSKVPTNGKTISDKPKSTASAKKIPLCRRRDSR